MTPQDYVTRIEGVLGSPLINGEARVHFHYDTLAEVRQQMARVRTLQRNLRLVKKDVGFTIKQVRSSYTAQRAEVGTGLGSGLVAGFFGRKAAGRMNAANREDLRRQRLGAIAPYEKVSRFIDELLMQFDTGKTGLQQWMVDRKYQLDDNDNPGAAQSHPLPALPPPIPLPVFRHFVYLNDAVAGPYTLDQIKALHETGVVTGDTLCCREGTEDWIAYASLLSNGGA